MVIKKPLEIDCDNENVDDLVEKISYAIEQHSSFMKLVPAEVLKSEEELNKQRDFWEY